MRKAIVIFIAGAFLALSIILPACKKDDPQDPPALAYIGSDKCAPCHQAIYDKFIKSGHPYKLNKVEGGVQPLIPYTTDNGVTIPTPAGYTWNDVSWLIGGYGWKARFVDLNGYIMSDNPDTQYNLEDGTQVAYHAGDAMGTLKYNCGRCHTTGWVSVADGGSPKDGLPGMDGDFFAGGVHCEECHGMGSVHAFTEDKGDITLDKTSDLCGSCHYRNSDHTIAASGGFIKHHEQYDEWLTSGHNTNDIGCNTCHDPHSSVVNDAVAPGDGVTQTCATCHTSKSVTKHAASTLTCETCHMPKISKSAIQTGDYKGDIRTHIFKINPLATGTMFNAAGDLANPDGLGMSLDYVCYQCHKDATGAGGTASTKTMTELSNKATNFH